MNRSKIIAVYRFMVYFGLLGPLLVRDDAGRPLPIRASRHRTVLAALLLHANRTVTTDTLADMLWEGRKPPPRHRAVLLNYLSRLRGDLGPGLRKRIETRPAGYAVLIEDDLEFDLRVLAGLDERANVAKAADDWEQARRYAEQALMLWRDEPLATAAAGAKAAADGQGTTALPRPVPRQLPAPPRHFAGRVSELAALDNLLNDARPVADAGAEYPVSIVTILGAAGIGKTTLASHWAYQVADRFPSGQLYADLRGFNSSARPAAPGLPGHRDA
jgi:Transcriptional regulatory protein, C terminal